MGDIGNMGMSIASRKKIGPLLTKDNFPGKFYHKV